MGTIYYIKMVKDCHRCMANLYFYKGFDFGEEFEIERLFSRPTQPIVNSMAVRLSREPRYRGCMFEVWKYSNGTHSRTAFSIDSEIFTTREIEKCLMRGRAVSSHDMNRFLRSSRGMMFVSMMNSKNR